MRAFVAVFPPDAALAELAHAVAPLRAEWPDLRWTPAAQWHLTLAFLGEIDERLLPELTERLGRAARRHCSITLRLAGAGRFGDRVLLTRVHGVAPAAPEVRHGVTPAARESPVSTGRVPHLDRDGRGQDTLKPVGESSGSVRRVERSGTAKPAPVHAPRADGGVRDLRRLATSVTAAARRCGIPVDDRPYRPHLTLARGREGVDLRALADRLSGYAGSAWTADALHLVRSRLGAGPGGTAAHDVLVTWPLSG